MDAAYKTMKVFDYQKMPKDVQIILGEKYGPFGNRSYVKIWDVYEDLSLIYPDTPESDILFRSVDKGLENYGVIRGRDILNDWLYDNGARMFESVLVNVWW